MLTKKENVSRETFSFFVSAPGGVRLRSPFLTVHAQHRPGKCTEVKNRSTSGSCGEAEQAFQLREKLGLRDQGVLDSRVVEGIFFQNIRFLVKIFSTY